MKRIQPLVIAVFFFSTLLTACAAVKTDPAYIMPRGYQPCARASSFEQPTGRQNDAVKNVILMIGDGMGLSHIWLSRVAAAGVGGRLNMECMPVSGLVTTYSATNLKTDSAAAATALATGRKTRNGMISELPDGTKPKTLLEKAEERRMATGLLATKAITDATPAGFSAHNASRDDQSAIAVDILARGIEVIMGGGRKYWLPILKGGQRTDGRDLTLEATQKGYRYITGRQELTDLKTLPVLALWAENSLDEDGDGPTLAAMTAKATQLLSRDPGGFFLLVEGSQIDTRSHRHDAAEVVKRVLEFDAAVKEAITFAARDGHTLVIVTADHETGGLVVLDGLKRPKISWASFDHSSTPVNLFAYGPGAGNFTGMYDNTEVALRIAALLGFTPFPEDHPSPPEP